jgi:hypothetical protein
MSVKQFNASYYPNDDRIIFRFNTSDHSEFKFWLTRRITHFILVSAAQFIEKEYEKNTPSVEKVMSELHQPEKQAANFAKEYQPGKQYPMGGDAILVLDARCAVVNAEGQDIFSLDFLLPGGSSINLKLAAPILKALVMLLEELNAQARWGSADGTFL